MKKRNETKRESWGTCEGGEAPSAGPGRFVLVPQLMNIVDAAAHCRQNFASLASIHSWQEQQQAKDVCRTADHHACGPADDWNRGACGCWIGLEDSAQEGGFTWTE